MASLYDMVTAFQRLGASLREAGNEAEQAAGKVRELRTEEAKSTTSGITSGASGGGSLSAESSYLGDPRDATNQAARMIAAINNATGR